MNDLSSGGDTDEEAYELYIKSKVGLAEGGSNLRTFVTNPPELRRQIEHNESELSKISRILPTGEDMYDSGILEDALVSDRIVDSSWRTVIHQDFIRRRTGERQI